MPSEALPKRPYITLAEAALWLSGYKPLDRDRLRGLRKWPRLAGKHSKKQLLSKWWNGEPLPPYRLTRAAQMRARVEGAAQRILDAARRGNLIIWGVPAAGGQHCQVPEAYLASEIIADPITDQLVADVTKTFDDMPAYKNIRFARRDLEKTFGVHSNATTYATALNIAVTEAAAEPQRPAPTTVRGAVSDANEIEELTGNTGRSTRKEVPKLDGNRSAQLRVNHGGRKRGSYYPQLCTMLRLLKDNGSSDYLLPTATLAKIIRSRWDNQERKAVLPQSESALREAIKVARAALSA